MTNKEVKPQNKMMVFNKDTFMWRTILFLTCILTLLFLLFQMHGFDYRATDLPPTSGPPDMVYGRGNGGPMAGPMQSLLDHELQTGFMPDDPSIVPPTPIPQPLDSQGYTLTSLDHGPSPSEMGTDK